MCFVLWRTNTMGNYSHSHTTYACVVSLHVIFLTTSNVLTTPTAAVSDHRHPRSGSDSTNTAYHSRWLDRAFPVTGSRFWNRLPRDITSAPTLAVFRKRLKTFLCSRSFPALTLFHTFTPFSGLAVLTLGQFKQLVCMYSHSRDTFTVIPIPVRIPWEWDPWDPSRSHSRVHL